MCETESVGAKTARALPAPTRSARSGDLAAAPRPGAESGHASRAMARARAALKLFWRRWAVAIYLHGLAGVSPRRRFDIRAGAHFTAILALLLRGRPGIAKKAQKPKPKKPRCSSCAHRVQGPAEAYKLAERSEIARKPKKGDLQKPSMALDRWRDKKNTHTN